MLDTGGSTFPLCNKNGFNELRPWWWVGGRTFDFLLTTWPGRRPLLTIMVIFSSGEANGNSKYGVWLRLTSTTLTTVLHNFPCSLLKRCKNASGQGVWLENSLLKTSASTTIYICGRPSRTKPRSSNQSSSVLALWNRAALRLGDCSLTNESLSWRICKTSCFRTSTGDLQPRAPSAVALSDHTTWILMPRRRATRSAAKSFVSSRVR